MVAYVLIGNAVVYGFHYVLWALISAACDGVLMYVQLNQIKKLTRQLAKDNINDVTMREQLELAKVSISWLTKFQHLVDEFNQSAAPLMLIVFCVSIPVMCIALFISLALKSDLAIRIIGIGFFITMSFINSGATLTSSLVGQWIDHAYPIFTNAVIQLKSRHRFHYAIKWNLACKQELIGDQQLGVYCLDLFRYEHMFLMNVSLISKSIETYASIFSFCFCSLTQKP